MYLVPDRQLADAIRFIEEYAASLDTKETRPSERKRLASLLLKRLEKAKKYNRPPKPKQLKIDFNQ